MEFVFQNETLLSCIAVMLSRALFFLLLMEGMVIDAIITQPLATAFI